jgi:hypothetical protein
LNGAKSIYKAVKKSLALSAYPVESQEMMLGDVSEFTKASIENYSKDGLEYYPAATNVAGNEADGISRDCVLWMGI